MTTNRYFDSDIDPFTGKPLPWAANAWEAEEVSAEASEGTYEYALIKSAPEVPAEECEVASACAEVVVRWGGDILAVSHMSPLRAFYVGEEERPNLPCDFLVPAEKLGTSRAPLALVGTDGALRAVILPGATGTVEIPGAAALTVRDAIESGAAEPCPQCAGAFELRLTPGARVITQVAGFEFEVASVRAGKRVAGHAAPDKRGIGFACLSALVHAGLLASMWGFMPPLGASDDAAAADANRYELIQAMSALAEVERDRIQDDTTTETPDDGPSGGTGARAMNEEGKMGSEVSTATNKKWALEKHNDGPQYLSRAEALRDAADFGMVGLLNNGPMGDMNAPTAEWGELTSNGADAFSAKGNMWGAELGEAAGAGGLGLSGIGEGGGGRFEGIGLGYIGTLGHGSGQCTGPNCDGFGNSRGFNTGTHTPRARAPREGTTEVSGRIPPEIIQRVVRQNFGRFRLCYQDALRNNPNLAGRVAVRFVIGRDGAVSNVANGGSDLPDAGVVSCVVRAFYGLSFPAPDGGIVTVTYPIMFSPGAS
jgi:hypothetical protein